MKEQDEYTRTWIIENALEEIQNYQKGVLTVRGLHYRLVARGMTNTVRHYKRVCSALVPARWDGVISFDTFSDNDREMIGNTDADKTVVEESIESAKDTLSFWMKYYRKNRWENQPIYPEVFIEKKALQGVFQPVCDGFDVALGACKGYPSLTFVYEAAERFKAAVSRGQLPVILYFGDYDPSGEDIPRSLEVNLKRFGIENIQVKRISLLEDQVVEWNLPPAPAKETDSRTAAWSGLGQVELDAVEPSKIQELCEEAIESVFDSQLHNVLLREERAERKEYQAALKIYVNNELSNNEEE